MTETHTGRCECGGVSYAVAGPMRAVSNCHCGPCRRITGHFMAATAAPTDAIGYDSDETLRWYERTATLQYGFCHRCGSTLFWRNLEAPETVSIAAGTIDPPTGLHTAEAIHVADASDYHHLDPDIDTYDYER